MGLIPPPWKNVLLQNFQKEENGEGKDPNRAVAPVKKKKLPV
jgi:hypothetical protein